MSGADVTVNVVGGRVVSSAGITRADLRIESGRVRRVVPTGQRLPDSDETIDATGCYVLPGGVDPHTHLLPGIRAATGAAAFGGTTSALSFTAPELDEPAPAAFWRARTELARDAVVDVGLHAAIWRPERLTRADLGGLRELGVSGVKLYLAYSELGMLTTDRRFFEVMVAARELGMRIQVHCENDGLLTALAARHVAAGLVGPKHFAASRPPEAEEEAINRALSIAAVAQAPLYIAHVTTGEGLRLIRRARARGQVVWAEVCLPHLFLSSEVYERWDAERFLLAPPLRTREQAEALWAGVGEGVVSTVGTDHSQVRFRPGAGIGGFDLAYGLAGVEVRVPLVLSAGRRRGIPLERLVQVLAEAPARAFGHHPAKGVLAPGSDADVILWDPEPRWTIDAEALHDPSVDCPYAGMQVEGRVRDVLLRGRILVRDGEPTLAQRGGRFLPALQASPLPLGPLP